MTININELRRLAQAATPGPDGVSLSWIKLLQDFQQGANPAAISKLLDRLEEAESDALEQARLNGMGSEREAALMAKLEAAEKERDALRARIEAMERQEPAGTLHDDGYFVWNPRCRPDSNYVGWKTKLYLAPGAKGEQK